LAGKAINISKTTAPHALSYWITTHLGVSHGAAVALFIGRFLVYNAAVSDLDCNDPRGAEHVRRRVAGLLEVLGVDDVAAGRKKLEGLIKELGCPVTLRDVGIDDDSKLATLCERANVERLSNNPRKLSRERLFDLLRESSAAANPPGSGVV
jgi:alcohol dehydrogenase class IV